MKTQTANVKIDSILSVYRPRVTAFISKMTQDDSDLEDLVQETLIKVARGLENFRGDSALSTWIFTIASNVVNDYFRSRSPGMESFEEGKTVIASSSDGALKRIDKKEMGDCVSSNISFLPEAYRRILITYYMDGATLKEIAAKNGVTENSVKVRLHRARKRFRAVCFASCDLSFDGSGEIVCGPKEKTDGC